MAIRTVREQYTHYFVLCNNVYCGHIFFKIRSPRAPVATQCCHALLLFLLGYDDDDSHGLAHLQHSAVGPEST